MKQKEMFFCNSLAFSMILQMFWQFDHWFLCLFETQLVHLKFSDHVLLKPNLKDFEYNLASL